MPPFGLMKRIELIRALRTLGFEGLYATST